MTIYCQSCLTSTESTVALRYDTIIFDHFGRICPTAVLAAEPLLRYNVAVTELHIQTEQLVTSLGF